MKKMSLANALFAVLMIAFVWFPYTRLFMIGFQFGDYLVFFLAVALFISSLSVFLKSRNKLDLIPLFVSLSPFLFIAISLILVYFNIIPFAP